MINIDKIYDLMADKGFQEPGTGNLFFPAYIYTYNPEDEYEMRKKINAINENLKRPNHFLECKVLNVFNLMIDYLKNEKFGDKAVLDLILDKEKENPSDAHDWLYTELSGDAFYNFVDDTIADFFDDNTTEKKVYLLMYGFGASFPFIRASDFLKNIEKLIKNFKIIIFYPGYYKDANYNLFGILNDDNMYRANHLNKILGENF